MRRPRVLYVGTFNATTYSRGRILAKGLRACAVPIDLFLPDGSLAAKCAAIARRVRARDHDVIIATGKFAFWTAKLFGHAPIAFEGSTSDYDTLVINRKRISRWNPLAWALWIGDRVTCQAADIPFLDTQTHVDWHRRVLRIPRVPFRIVRVGADEDVFFPMRRRTRTGFHVMYFGTYIPIHGLDHVLDAAKILRTDPATRDVRFHFLGKGMEYDRITARIKKERITNIIQRTDVTLANGLTAYLADADLCLGMFGTQATTDMVIAHKIFETMAIGKPLLTGQSAATAEIFRDGKDLLFCPRGDGVAIADAVRRLRKDPRLAARIAQQGHATYLRRYTNKAIGKELLTVLRGAIRRRRA